MPTLQVVHESTDITSYILDYKRELDICTGIGTITITVAKTYSGTFEVWDTLEVYEDSNKRGEFNVGKISTDGSSLNKTVFAQDNSKKLADYFIAESYYINYYSTTRYWIEKFMADAGVTCTFTTTSQGAPISKETTLGVESAYEIIVTLLQQSGWYMYFNDSGNAVVGVLSLDLGNYKKSFNDDDILSIKKSTDDKMLRNRAVVWGNAQVETGQWVFADLRKNTTWNYDQNDLRTVLFSNHEIPNNTIALDLANKILTEFCRITETKELQLHGFHNVHIGDFVMVRSKYHNGMGLITSLNVSANKDGYITNLVLDERCPRLFSYYGFDQGKVYCGTNGDGVWQKDLDGSLWSDFSTGILDLQIKDLAIANGIFACVTSSGQAYIRDLTDASWSFLSYGDFVDELDGTLTSASIVTAKACAVNRATSEVYILFQGGGKAWVGLIVNKVLLGTQQIYVDLNGTKYTNLSVFDVDTDDLNVYVTAGMGGLPGSVFLQYPFPVIEAFTHNDLETWREFSQPEPNSQPSNIVWDYGKVHLTGLPTNPISGYAVYPNAIRVSSFDFSGTTVIDNSSGIITVPGEVYFGTPHAFLSVGGTYLYLLLTNGNVYRYRFDNKVLEYIENIGTAYDGVFNNITYTITYSINIDNDRVYNFAWYDIETGESGDHDFATIPDRHNVWADTSGTWNHFGSIGFVFYFIGKNNNSVLDNAATGCCSYDSQYFPYVHMYGLIFNCVTKSMTHSFNEIIHPNATLDPSDALCTSHAFPSSSTYYQKGIFRWTHINYQEGVPWIWGQYMISDEGPWVGASPPYSYLGYRDGYYESPPEYPRHFKYNIATQTLYPLDVNDINTLYYSVGGYQEYLGDLTLSNSPYSDFYHKQYASGVPVYEPWRDVEQNPASNTYMQGWNSTEHVSQWKMDYFYSEFPVVYDAGGGTFDFYTYPPTPLPGRPATSGWVKKFQIDYLPAGLAPASITNQASSQNVYAVRYSRSLYRSWWNFYQFGDWADFLLNAYFTTVNTTSGFSIIDLTTLPHALEVGASGPVITYAKAISGMATKGGIPDGKLRVGLYSPSGLLLPSGYTFGAAMPSGIIPNYTFITPSGNYTVVMDARPFTMNPSTQLPLNSGYITTSGITTIGIAMDNAIYVKTVDKLLTSGWDALVVLSETTTNFETTNFFPSPYLFTATVSGIVPSGIVITLSGISKFYQRNPYSSYWTNFSPIVSSYITCIRVDDRL